MDRFDRMIEAIQMHGSSGSWREALCVVADTALICRAWLDEKQPGFATGDLMAMTKMVLDREVEIVRRKEAEDLRNEGAE